MRDFTFSDGTFVPAGSTMFVNSYGAHYDPANYSSPSEFKGFRFVVDDTSIHPRQSQHANGGNEAEKQERQQPQQLLVKPTLNYQPFGYGRLAWCVLSISLNIGGQSLISSGVLFREQPGTFHGGKPDEAYVSVPARNIRHSDRYGCCTFGVL